MNIEIICAIIAVVGVAASSVASWLISRAITVNEIKKLKLTWAREDAFSADNEFAEMVAAISEHIALSSHETKGAAIAKISALRAKEHGVLAIYLDRLCFDIINDFSDNIYELLDTVIEQKREQKGHRQEPCANAPK